MLVNEIKTKVMAFGTKLSIEVLFNGNYIEQVEEYKYIGNIIKAVRNHRADVFKNNYPYLCDTGRKAIFSAKKKLQNTGILPPSSMFYMFDSLIKLLLMYGSDVWGGNDNSGKAIDKVFMKSMKYVLGVKATTSNIITVGECG